MQSIVVAVAQYALFAVALAAAVVWLRLPGRHEKVVVAAQVVVAAVLVAVLVKVASALHTDPRPFVTDPHLTPWFAHPADNGFPSDHTALASAVSFVVLAHRRSAGLLLLAVSVLIGVARVMSHVHHVQDIVAGLLIGLVAAGAAVLASGWVESRRWQQKAYPRTSKGSRRYS
jgi:membrane-associated phospholipid phosphatase